MNGPVAKGRNTSVTKPKFSRNLWVREKDLCWNTVLRGEENVVNQTGMT